MTTLETISDEGFTLNQRFTSIIGKQIIYIELYQKGNEFIQYNPKDDTIISRYKVARKEFSLGKGEGI